MTIEPFGTLPDGQAAFRVTIQGGGLTARFLSFGAILQDLRLDGHAPPLVLGLNSLDDYLRDGTSMGITAGRCANRIRNGQFTLEGQSYQLDRNQNGKHHLHGGSEGTGRQNWQVVDAAPDHVQFALHLPDGHMGYPGNVRIRAIYSLLDGGVLQVVFEAESDAPTLCNLAHHSYFNLTGGPDLSRHRMHIMADRVTAVDDELVPTGRLIDVTGTAYDFRRGVDLGKWPEEQLLDHNFCVSESRVALRQVASLESDAVNMQIWTTEPGLQVYDGAKLNVTTTGLDGARYGARAGIAIEPQVWPDAINHAGFPSAVLRPNATYRQTSQFVFSN